ncbi:4-hydroxy-tetrahydrodipicolinate synthase [Hathewaya proteolytica DSM 3090]|uniref:4-hydroxy-tetrahydrodipicolinate synthase n=1 Tax=Hathewaya proteolytica DSM 3090 TaxID=1121331 RepID=A0A1M6QQM8_9CLOT|nr:4-hydroxy-tetrahydrodipicolinate synthase [Hathewaya proteolytica]SHK22589.1 4-hydroxy-tetrahydrodipicolinate synthase [Hathewaya proteolytica DSM 3090]
MSIFKGSGVAIITPFTENGVNYETLKELLDFHLNSSTDAIIICGTTGEASTMTEAERKETIKFTVDYINKRIPVIAGTGSNNTASAIEMSKYAQSVGVDGLLVITPYYNKTTQQGLVKHFKAIDNAVSVPIILYNVPSRTGVNIQPDTLVKIIGCCSNVVAIKEASGDISQVAKISAQCGDSIDIYSGNDDQIIPILALGGSGVISVFANVAPKETHDLVMSYLNGDVKTALDIQLKYLSLMNALFIETNPIPVKTALSLMKYKVGDLRLPLCNMGDNNLQILVNELKKCSLI